VAVRPITYAARLCGRNTLRAIWSTARCGASCAFMPLRDVAYLIINPFVGKQRGPTQAKTLSRAEEHGRARGRDRNPYPSRLTDGQKEALIAVYRGFLNQAREK
jgi:hypothetical protein